METSTIIIIIICIIVGIFVVIGLTRATINRCKKQKSATFGENLLDFLSDLIIFDLIGDLFSWIGDSIGDIDISD